jgi:hypothetical protein
MVITLARLPKLVDGKAPVVGISSLLQIWACDAPTAASSRPPRIHLTGLCAPL